MDLRSIRRFPAALHGLRERARRCAQLILAFVKRNGGRIAYYALVVVALCAIARAAEIYRADSGKEDALVLPAADAMDVLQVEEAAPEVLLPEEWELLRGYSDAPQWRSELGMWETHPAVDYDCAGGVLCLREGTVRTVGESGVYGGFVEVESDGALMRYASIEPADGLEPGLALDAGDAIGTADASMPGEADAGAHLHLELYLEGEAADFARYAQECAAAD